jgi:hypothetical protein
MKTTPTRTSNLRLLAAVLSLGFATDLCASVVELDTGSLELGGALEADHVIVGSLATLDGDGTVVARVTIAGTLSGNGFFEGVVNVLAGGRLTPGNSAGTLTVYNNLTLESGSTYTVEIDGALSDQTVAQGVASLDNATLSLAVLNGPSAASFTLLSADHVTGQFAGLAESVPVTLGEQTYYIHYTETAVLLTRTADVTGGTLVPIVTLWPIATTIANGQSLANASLSGGNASNALLTAAVSGGFTFTASETVPGAGVYLASVTFTPTDPASYNSVTGETVRVNRSPAAGPNTAGTSQGQTLTISAAKLLNNDTDADTDTLTVLSVTSPSAQGKSVSLADGVVTYAAGDFHGVDTFTYTASDGFGGTALGTVTVTVADVATGGVSLNIVGNIAVTDNTFAIRFAGIPGYTYTIEHTDSLSSPDWQKAGNRTAPVEAGLWGIGIFEFSESTGGAASRFYRTVWPSY